MKNDLFGKDRFFFENKIIVAPINQIGLSQSSLEHLFSIERISENGEKSYPKGFEAIKRHFEKSDFGSCVLCEVEKTHYFYPRFFIDPRCKHIGLQSINFVCNDCKPIAMSAIDRRSKPYNRIVELMEFQFEANQMNSDEDIEFDEEQAHNRAKEIIHTCRNKAEEYKKHDWYWSFHYLLQRGWSNIDHFHSAPDFTPSIPNPPIHWGGVNSHSEYKNKYSGKSSKKANNSEAENDTYSM